MLQAHDLWVRTRSREEAALEMEKEPRRKKYTSMKVWKERSGKYLRTRYTPKREKEAATGASRPCSAGSLRQVYTRLCGDCKLAVAATAFKIVGCRCVCRHWARGPHNVECHVAHAGAAHPRKRAHAGL